MELNYRLDLSMGAVHVVSVSRGGAVREWAAVDGKVYPPDMVAPLMEDGKLVRYDTSNLDASRHDLLRLVGERASQWL